MRLYFDIAIQFIRPLKWKFCLISLVNLSVIYIIILEPIKDFTNFLHDDRRNMKNLILNRNTFFLENSRKHIFQDISQGLGASFKNDSKDYFNFGPQVYLA